MNKHMPPSKMSMPILAVIGIGLTSMFSQNRQQGGMSHEEYGKMVVGQRRPKRRRRQ